MASAKRIVVVWAIAGVILMGLGATLFHLLMGSKPTTPEELNFPVLILVEGGSMHSEDNADAMRKVPKSRSPVEGAFVIDSDFKMFTQENVKCTTGDIGWIFHYLVGRNLTFTFDLKKCKKSGIDAAREKVLTCGYYMNGEITPDMRLAIAKQNSMKGILDVLAAAVPPPPPEPETQPADETEEPEPTEKSDQAKDET